MNNLFAGQKDEWIALANIDYFGAFIKAYIPFNAWMNFYYPSLQKDREKINAVKSTPNTFRNKICALLDLDSQEGSHFRNLIGDLHDMLEKHYIHNQDKRITFTNITLGRNPDKQKSEDYNSHHFFVKVSDNQVQSIVQSNTTKEKKIDVVQTEYNVEELKKIDDYIKLSNSNKIKLLELYQKVNPYIEQNFIISGYELNEANKKNKIELEMQHYQCGDYKFIKEPVLLAQGLIEILYNLRCSLFHGEIMPNKEANQVYGAAYRILYTLIQSL